MDLKALALLLPLASAACSTSTPPPDGPTAPGCTAFDVRLDCPSPPPSWSRDVQPLVDKYCGQCHGVGGIDYASRPYDTYAHVKQQAPLVAEFVSNCLMPNQDASPPPKAYPTEAERKTIAIWAGSCQAPEN